MLGLILLPLTAAALALGLRFVGRPLDHVARWLLPVATGAELLLAIRLAMTFSEASEEGRIVEPFPLGGAILGADGISLAMVLFTTGLAFLAALTSLSSKQRLLDQAALQSLALAGIVGVVVALDLALFFAFWLVSAVALSALVRLFAGAEAKRGTMHLAVWQGVCLLALLFASLALRSHAESFSIPELALVDHVSQGTQLFGTSFVKLVFSALFVAFVGTLAMSSLSRSIVRALAEAPPGVGILLAGAFVPLGGYGLLRVAFEVLPEASAWAAPTLAISGLVIAVVGTLRALREQDVSRFSLHAMSAQLGLALFALASLTPAGIQAGVVLLLSHGLALAMLLVLGRALHERVATRGLDRFGGLAQAMPLHAGFLALASLAALGAPGLLGFVGGAMGVAGAFPVYTELSLLALLILVVVGMAWARTFGKLCFGAVPESWRSSPYLEPFGGKFPDLRRGEWLPLALAGAALLILGFWPRPLLRLLDVEALRLTDKLRPLGLMQIALEELWQKASTLLS